MLELKNVNTYYGVIQALRDVSLHVDEGEIVTLIGANGAGKSTTLMTICGIQHPRSGSILFKGKPIHELPPNEIVKLGISQVPEGRLIFPELTVAENLDLGAFLRRDKDGMCTRSSCWLRVHEFFPLVIHPGHITYMKRDAKKHVSSLRPFALLAVCFFTLRTSA